MTLVAAAEMGRYGVTVNAIAPSARTRMTETVFADMMASPGRGFRRDGAGKHFPAGGLARQRRVQGRHRQGVRGGGRHRSGLPRAGRTGLRSTRAPGGILRNSARWWANCWPRRARRFRFTALNSRETAAEPSRRGHDGRVRRMRLPALVGAMLLLLAGCGGQRGDDSAAAETEPTSCEVTSDARLSIATGNTTGVYYTLGGAYAEAISQQTGGQAEGDRRGDVGVAAEHPAAGGGHPSGRVLARRHRRRRRQRHGVVRREAADRGADAAVSQLHPGDRPRGRRHQLDRRYARQAGVHRGAELRHRGDRQPDAARPPGSTRPKTSRRSAPNWARPSRA